MAKKVFKLFSNKSSFSRNDISHNYKKEVKSSLSAVQCAPQYVYSVPEKHNMHENILFYGHVC